jgi:hypothetical protein
MIGSSGSNAQIFYEGLDSIIVIFICGYFKPWEILHFEIEGSDGAGAVDKVIKGQGEILRFIRVLPPRLIGCGSWTGGKTLIPLRMTFLCTFSTAPACPHCPEIQ